MSSKRLSNQDKRGILEAQIAVRMEVLRKWLSEGAPKNGVPTRLAQVRRWTDETLGIKRIGSSSSFVKTHERHGAHVKEIEELLKQLHQKRRPEATSVTTRNRKQRMVISHMKRAMVNAANQHVMVSIKLEACEKELRLASQETENLRKLLGDQRESNRELRKEMSKLTASDSADGKVKHLTFPRRDRQK